MKDFFGNVLLKGWKVLRVIFIVVAALTALIGIISNGNAFFKFLAFWFASMTVLTILAVEILKKGYENRCVCCKKWFAVKYIGRELVDKEAVQVLTRINRYNVHDEFSGSQEQYVPGYKYTYHMNYKCKFCRGESYLVHEERKINR